MYFFRTGVENLKGECSMRHLYLAFCVLGAFASSAFADLTVHVQSPFGATAAAEIVPHVVLNSASPEVGATSSTVMKAEGENWYSITWKNSLAEFKASDVFTVKGCPATATDATTCVDFGDGITYNVRDFFDGSSEAWIYTDATAETFAKSFAAPGSKIVWFKSPWGNKALPQMIFEQDTILMHFTEDADKCGWFYGALTPAMLEGKVLQTAYFTRYMAPWMAVPADRMQIIDLSSYISKKDTVYIDGTVATPTIGNKAGEPDANMCFDKSRTLHVYNPWRNNSVYKDRTVYLNIDGVWLDSTKGLSFDAGYKFWLSVTFPDSVVSSAAWKSADARVQITRSFKERGDTVHYFSKDKRPIASDLFPSGVYETWFFASSTMEEIDLSYVPLERKVVRFLSPWKNTPTSFIVDANNDVVRMSTFSKDTCGWFEGTYYKHAADWKVYFKQSFGLEKYDKSGVVREGEEVDLLIDLDSLMNAHDTVYVYPSDKNKNYSRPDVSAIYPVGRLGVCPSMKISAMLLDWAGESHHDSIDVDFGRVHSGNDYTTVNFGGRTYRSCQSGTVTGMVQDTLVNGVPARVDSTKFPWDKCAAAHEIEKWFKPEIQMITTAGDTLTNSLCKDIELQLDNDGFWYADYTNESNDCNDPVSPGFFPLDDFKYLDTKGPTGTIPNPKFDWDVPGWTAAKGNDTCRHNYSYAMAVSASFKYVKGQYFEFRGDDDVWVYINNRLVVDIGGVHEKVEGAVNLDTIGQNNPKLALIEGREYPFHILYAERNATGSNFKKNDIKGILKLQMDSKAISCDPRVKGEVEITDAPSMFYLDGGNFSDSPELKVGINFGGITINEDRSSFVINIDEIVKQRSLSPGHYTLYYFLENDMGLYDSFEFTVPEYPKPEIAFVDVFNPATDGSLKTFDPTNKTIRGETIIPGVNDTLMTHVRYPEMVYLEIVVTYAGEICTDCNVFLDLRPSDARLTFYNEMDQQVNTVQTDETGRARFYVVGEGAIKGASFAVVGISGVKNQLTWDKISFKDPAVPLAKTGTIYDRNGDGVPDSIYVPFEYNAFVEHDLDTIAWSFGSIDWHVFSSLEDIATMLKNDSTVVITADSLLDSVLTGATKAIVEGNFRYHYIYLDEASGSTQESDMLFTKIQEKIGAIMLDKPMLKIVSENLVKVTIELSETCNATNLQSIRFIELKDKNDNLVDPSLYRLESINPSGESEYYELLFRKSPEYIAPEVGFKIRLLPGVLPDLNGNTPHENNPWRRIEGEQPLETERPNVVTIRPGMFDDNPWIGGDNDVAPIRVDEDLTLKEIIDEKGLPGVLVKFQLNDYATTQLYAAGNPKPGTPEYNEILSKVKVKWDIEFFTSLGHYVNWIRSSEFACNDTSIYKTDCIRDAGNMFFEWNALSEEGRTVGTGVYIAKFKFRIFSESEVMAKGEETFTFGIRRDETYETVTKKIK